jgi:hypothetical protein
VESVANSCSCLLVFLGTVVAVFQNWEGWQDAPAIKVWG